MAKSYKMPRDGKITYIKNIYNKCLLHEILRLSTARYALHLDYGDAVKSAVIYSKLLITMYGKH